MLKKINKLTLNKLNKKLNRISTGILLVIFVLFAFLVWWFRKPMVVQNVTQTPKPKQKESSRENNIDVNATGVIKVENGILTGPANTDDLPEGVQNLYFRASRVTPIVWNIVNTLTTDNITEGNHLYYTDDRVYNALSAQSPITFDSNNGVISLELGGITQEYIAHNNVYPVHLYSINAPTDGWLLQYNATNNSFEWVPPSSFNSETTTTITNTVSGHKIADYTNEQGIITPINETVTSLSLSGNTLIFTNETGTANNINLPVQHSIWDTDTDTGINLEASPDEDYIRFYTYGNQRAAIDNRGNVILSTYNPNDFINPGTFSGILFNAGKNAFRIGFADNNEWDDSNVGLGTLASGRNNIVSGNYSAALGGNNNINDVYSVALGRYLDVSSSYSFAGGYQNTASGYASAVLGQQNTVSGRRAFAWGMDNQAIADEATAFGYNAQASGTRSLAFGNSTTASGAYAVAFGSDTLASGTYATAFGRSTVANNSYAAAWGNDTEASGYGSTAFGYRTAASGQYSIATGYYSEASGNNAVAFNDTVANSYMMTAVGRFNVVDNNQSPNTWVDTDYLFVVGNGTGYQSANRHNALSIYKNGRLEINAPVDEALLSNHPTGHVPLALATVGYVNSHVGDSIFDADSDTGIQVEANPDEDFIRMQTGGVERFLIDNQGHMRLANNPASTSRAALFEVGSGSESSTFAVSADPNYLNIATFRDQDGENIFRAQGSLGSNDLIVTFGDWDWAYDHFSFGLDKSQDSFDFFNGEIRIHEWSGAQSDYVGFRAPTSIGTSIVWTLPDSDGGNGYLLQTDGSGQLSWVAQSSLNAPNIYNIDGSLTAERTVDLNGNNLLFTGSGNIGVGTTSPSYTLDVNGDINTTGIYRVNGIALALDHLADAQNNSSYNNLFLGHAGFSGTYYNRYNTVVGLEAFTNPNTDNSQPDYGNDNTVIGYQALTNNTTGYSNTAIGRSVLTNNTTGYFNTGIGRDALNQNTTGYSNSAFGRAALFYNTSGTFNTAVGVSALYSNTDGYRNVANGSGALYFNTTGYFNTAVGAWALYNNTTGVDNVALGSNAGRFIADNITENKTGSYNVFLGVNTRPLADGDTNEIVIGYDAVGIGSNTVVLGNDNIVTTVLKGNVGIGTTAPVNKLQVVGNVRATRFLAANGTAGSPSFRFDSDSNTGMFLPAADTLAFTTNGTERYRINQDGLLTYGTTVTDYNLAYFGTQHSVIMVNQGAADMAAYAAIHYGDDTSPARIAFLKARGSEGAESALQNGDEIAEFASAGYDGSQYMTTGGLIVAADGAVSANNLPSRLDFLVNKGGGNLGADVVMTLDHNGNLGIGTQTPGYKLDVQGNANIFGDIHLHARLFDAADNPGANGQVLTVSGGVIAWKNPVSCVIGGAKVQADGTVINSYGDVASVTHSNTGRYRINFANSLNTNDYYVHLTKMESTSTRDDVNIDVSAYNTDYVDVIIHEGDNGTAANIYRDRAFAVTIFDANCVALSETGNPSDARLKTNIQTIQNPLSLITKLRGVRYNWNTAKYPNRRDFDNKPEIGLIAQEVKEVVPEVVDVGDDGYYRIEYGKMVGLLVEGIKSQQNEIVDLQHKTNANSKFNSLVSKVLGLENQLQNLRDQQRMDNSGLSDMPTPSLTPTSVPTLTPTDLPMANTDEQVDSQASNDDTSNTSDNNSADEQESVSATPLSKLVNGIWNIVSEVIFKYKVSFEKLVIFMSNVKFNKRVQFSDKDMAGFAVIKSGDTVVHISFDKPYNQTPVVNVTPIGISIDYYIDNLTTDGFDIVIKQTYTQDIKFTWLAINIKDAKVEYSHTPTPTVTGTQVPTTVPSSTQIVTPSPTPSQSPTPSSLPSVTQTPTPTNAPTPTSTITPTTSPTLTVTPTP